MAFTRLASSDRNVRTNYVLHVLMVLMYIEIEISSLRVYLYYLYWMTYIFTLILPVINDIKCEPEQNFCCGCMSYLRTTVTKKEHRCQTLVDID